MEPVYLHEQRGLGCVPKRTVGTFHQPHGGYTMQELIARRGAAWCGAVNEL